MKYDLIVVGGGPGGLVAAKSAAEDGLKVVLVERKRNIAEVNRACAQIFYLHKLHPVSATSQVDGYLDPVSVECQANKTTFHFYTPGFSIDYTGCLRPYLNWLHLSPGRRIVNRYKWNDCPWGYYVHKEAYLADVLAAVEKAGAEVLTETIALGAENTKDGVEVRVEGKSGQKTLEARAAIAADGNSSRIAEGLGLNKTRKLLFSASGGWVQYVMEGVETGLPEASWLTWAIPSLSRSSVTIGLSADNTVAVGALAAGSLSGSQIIEKFMTDSRYAHMFRHARLVKKEAAGLPMRTPMKEPVAGNIVIVGDAAGQIETWVQGASACGYQAVKAIEKELNGQKGYPEYIAWWQQAFGFNAPNFTLLMPSAVHNIAHTCNDEEVDYIYSLFEDKIGIPVVLLSDNLDLVKKDRPELYDKLTKGKQ